MLVSVSSSADLGDYLSCNLGLMLNDHRHCHLAWSCSIRVQLNAQLCISRIKKSR